MPELSLRHHSYFVLKLLRCMPTLHTIFPSYLCPRCSENLTGYVRSDYTPSTGGSPANVYILISEAVSLVKSNALHLLSSRRLPHSWQHEQTIVELKVQI